MKSMEEILEIRNKQFKRIRKAQMTIAIIDATITTDPRRMEQLEQLEGDVATLIPDVRELEQNPFAQFN